MNLRKIRAIEKKAMKEAQKAVDEIYSKYSKEIVEEISKQIPKGLTLCSINGINWLENEKGEKINSGRAWGLYNSDDDEQLTHLASLQYSDVIDGNYYIPDTIKGIKEK